MKKKNWLILISALVIICLGFGAWFLTRSKSTSVVSPLANQTETNEEQILKVWEDPAGFRFSYPEGVMINNHSEDEENYAHLELTNSSYPGRILVWMKDKTEKDLNAWLANQEGDFQTFDSELAGQSAKKLAFASPKKMVTTIFDQEVVILLEVYPEDEWWTKTYDQILTSFELIPLAGEDKAKSQAPGAWQPGTGDTGIIDEGEEVIE
jgi:hypothetical protein